MSIFRFYPCGIAAGSLFLSLLAAAAARADGPDAPASWPLIFDDDFRQGAERWQPTDERAWKIVKSDGKPVYSLFQQSKYEPPFRSPLNFSLARDAIVGDFSLETRLRSTVNDYPHRDLCLIFGYQDAAHFYYVHLGKQTDDHANQVFIVNGAPRTKISTKTTPGTAWDDAWHDVKIVRRVGNGRIEVYFDDMETPVMEATDKTFTWGHVGVGSFDDTGDFARVKLYGLKVERPRGKKDAETRRQGERGA